MLKTAYRYRLYPGADIEQRLIANLEASRWLYNQYIEALENARTRHKHRGEAVYLGVDAVGDGKTYLSDFDMGRMIPGLRANHPELGDCNARMLGMIPRRIAGSLRGLAELKKKGYKVGSLHYRAAGQYNVLAYNQSGYKADLEHGVLTLAKIGDVPMRVHRTPPDGFVVKGVVVTRDGARWYASLQLEIPRPNARVKSGVCRTVVLQFGLDNLVSDDQGTIWPHPEYYTKSLGRVKRAQRSISRKSRYKCSNCGYEHKHGFMPGRCPVCGKKQMRVVKTKNRDDARLKLRDVSDRIEAQRKDYLHVISKTYVERYDRIVIVKPDLCEAIRQNTRMGKPSANRRTLDAGIGELIGMIKYKAERAGVDVVIKPLAGKNINTKNERVVCAGVGSAVVPVE